MQLHWPGALAQLFALLKDICTAVDNGEQIVSSHHSVSGDSDHFFSGFDVAPPPAMQITTNVKCCLSHVVFFPFTITPNPAFLLSFSRSANSFQTGWWRQLVHAGCTYTPLFPPSITFTSVSIFCTCVGQTELAQSFMVFTQSSPWGS